MIEWALRALGAPIAYGFELLEGDPHEAGRVLAEPAKELAEGAIDFLEGVLGQ